MNHNTLVKVLLIALTSYGFYHMTRKQTTKKRNHDNHEILVVGTNAEYRPFSYIDHGRIVGFDIDLIKEVGKRLGKKVELHDMPFTTLIPDIQHGNIHVIAAGMSSTPGRAQQVDFTKPYVTGDPLLAISLKDSPSYPTIEDLKTKDVIVNQGFNADIQLSAHSDLNIKRLDTVADAFLALKNNQGDVFVSAQCSVDPYFKQYGKDAFTITELKGLTADNYVLAVSKEHPELLEQIQVVLDEMEQDGTLKNLKQSWNLDGICNP